jgi:hypothetical protein
MSTTGTNTNHPPSAPGLTHTVEYPSGVTKEWSERTVAARGFEVPVAVPERQTFGILDGQSLRVRGLVNIFASDLRNGDRVQLDGEFVEVTDVTRSGRDVSFRINGFRRKASAYRFITVAS